MDSQTLIQQTNSKLGIRVRMWKDSPDTLLSPSLTINNTKADLTTAQWIRKVSLRFSVIPSIFHLEVSDTGAYSFIKTNASINDNSVEVVDVTGWEIGTKIIFRSAGGTDIFTITNIVSDVITFDGNIQHNYTANTDTVEDDRWYKVATSRCDATATWLTLGESVDDHPMYAAYGRFWRIGPESVQLNDLSDFRLYPDTYYDLTDYVSGPIEISQRADLKTGDSPLTTCNIRLLNSDDRFNRRNLNSPYIDGTVNYLKRACRITIEWIAYGPDWEMAQVAGTVDWRLLGTFYTRRISIPRDEFSYAIIEGESLAHLGYTVDVPLLEATTAKDLITDWILSQEHREELAEGADDAIRHKVGVLEPGELARTNTNFQEIIGRGDFGNCSVIYQDFTEEDFDDKHRPIIGSTILYSGFYGIASDGRFLYTSHSMESVEGTQQRGVYIVRRFMSGAPVDENNIFMFYDADSADIEEGDICFVGTDIMWLHTAQQNVANNVYRIDWSDKDNPTETAITAAKGSAGHMPVHACSDGTFLYVLYDGGSEGRTLYKCNGTSYATIWSFQFTAGMNQTLDGTTAGRGGGTSGITLVGSATLVIFSRRLSDDGESNTYFGVEYTLSDTPTYVTEATTAPVEFITKMHPDDTMNNTYGWASVVQTSAGLLAMTGGGVGTMGGPSKADSLLWQSRGGVISRIATIKFFTQNGNIINDVNEYTSPKAHKDSANFPLEQVWVGGELQDNTGTYSGTTKTTDSYTINLQTGEILLIAMAQYGTEIRIDYDFKPGVQFFKADNVERWGAIRQLAQVSNAIAYTTRQGRVAVKLRRGQEDHILESGSGEMRQLRGRNIIHDSNSAYTFNTIQVANADHNYYYTEGTHYSIVYDSGTGIYTLAEIGTSFEGHIVVTYLQGPSDDSLILFDDDGQLNPPSMIGIPDENWRFDNLYNNIIIEGERSYPLDVPIVYRETYAISPQQLNIDARVSKIQKAEGNAQYDWDGDQKVFRSKEKENVSGSGFIVEFTDPLIIGTTKWVLREPDTSHVETLTRTEGGGAAFYKFTWPGSAFTEPGSAVETTNYDVLISNKDYWRECTKEDEGDSAWPAGPPDQYYKTGSYVYLKKVSDDTGDGSSDACTAYAYATKDTSFYVDAAGVIQEAEISDATNPSPTASPDKSLYVRISPTDTRGAHLFRQAGTYDSVAISADYAVAVGAVRIGYDGVSVDVNNYAGIEHYLQVLVVGFPISGIERVRVKCEDRITLDGTLSSIDELGERTHTIRNNFIQSVGMARMIGYSLLDWLKTEHSQVTVRDKFNDRLSLLEPCLVRAAYGNFDEETELWMVSEIHYSLVNGDSDMSSTTYLLVDMRESPSAPPAGSS